jgi:hypothetical protein
MILETRIKFFHCILLKELGVDRKMNFWQNLMINGVVGLEFAVIDGLKVRDF